MKFLCHLWQLPLNTEPSKPRLDLCLRENTVFNPNGLQRTVFISIASLVADPLTDHINNIFIVYTE